MSFNPQDLIFNLVGGGASPTKFEVELIPPFILGSTLLNGLQPGASVSVACKAASIPGSDLGVVRVNYKGREIKLAGDRVFSDWNIRILNGEDFAVRNMFVQWMNLLNSHEDNLRDKAAYNFNDYAVDMQVKQFSKVDDIVPIKVYQMVGAFPTSVGAIEVNWDNKDTIEEFSVTLQFQNWIDISNPETTSTRF